VRPPKCARGRPEDPERRANRARRRLRLDERDLLAKKTWNSSY
jgi:hypothetical protein